MDFEGEDENNDEMNNENDEMIDNMENNYNEQEYDNEMDENNQDDNNDYNYDENEYNDQIQQDNIENENYNENDLYEMNMENIKLKNKIQNLYKALSQKNNEIINLKNTFSQQMQIMNQNLNKYKNIAKNYSNLQNELDMTKKKYLKEIKIKNKIIFDLQKGVNINDLKVSNLTLEEGQNANQNQNLIFIIIQQIKSLENDILDESEILNEDVFQKLDTENQIQFLLNEIKILSEKLSKYKNNNILEISRLKKALELDNKNPIVINEQFYKDIINLIKKISNDNIINIKFPEFSVNDDEQKRENNIFNTIKILVEYITSKKNNKEKNKNDLDEELNKRIKEMSELLSKSNQNLSISTKNNNGLRLKYNELKEQYDNIFNKTETEKKKLMKDLNKKNQQIKSLEHLNMKLSNQINDNKIDDKKNIINKKPELKYGKINKTKNSKKNKMDKLNLFIKDEKSEKNLESFLDKFTNGEYGKNLKNNIENIDLDNLKDEIDKFNQKINKDLYSKENK